MGGARAGQLPRGATADRDSQKGFLGVPYSEAPSSADGFFSRATRFAGSPARSGASCSRQKGGGNYMLVCMRPAGLWQVAYERQESLQNGADCYFNAEGFCSTLK